MAVLHPYPVKCSCGNSFRALMADSVNASRSPKIREEILAGEFHRFSCPKCHSKMTIEKAFSYSDLTRNTFINVMPRQDRHLWRQSSKALDKGIRFLPKSISILSDRYVRVVFGLGELREKLIAEDAGVDDRLIEVLKVLLIQDHPILIKYPRLRLQLNAITGQVYEFVAGYEHKNKNFVISIPTWLAEQILDKPEELKNWINKVHGDASIYKVKQDYWMNIWRWSPQTSALESLRQHAEKIRRGQVIDVESVEFKMMLSKLPRGTQLPGWAKQDTQELFLFAKKNGYNKLQDTLFELRFDLGLEDDWAFNDDPEDIATLWKLLKDLPDTHVEGNTKINEIKLGENEGGGWYSPSTNDISIGAHELSGKESFEDVVRHEVGHAVHEKNPDLINNWLKDRFGWQIFDTSNADIDAWVDLMGGWGDLNSTHKAQVRGFLKESLGQGGSWNPGMPPSPPANHPWWKIDFGPRLAYEGTGASWYDNSANWFKSHGKAFFLNYWYRTFMVVNESVLDLIRDMPSSYAAMSHFEFFAELYALFYDLDDPQRPIIPNDVVSWLSENIGAPEPGAPAQPGMMATRPTELPEWHWITRPTTKPKNILGKVHYKFEYNSEIDFPESIEFDASPADLQNDNNHNFIIEGDVDGVRLDEDGKLPVFVSSSGRVGRTWKLSVTFNDKKLETFPIFGTIENNGFFTLNENYKVES